MMPLKNLNSSYALGNARASRLPISVTQKAKYKIFVIKLGAIIDCYDRSHQAVRGNNYAEATSRAICPGNQNTAGAQEAAGEGEHERPRRAGQVQSRER